MSQGFQSTRWSLVGRVADRQSPQGQRAWEEFYAFYQSPLLGFIRRTSWPSDEAEDLLQSFYSALADRNWLEDAKPENGKMRTFLLSRLKWHVNDALKRKRAIKRGGKNTSLSFDELEGTPAGERLEAEASGIPEIDDASREFDREWAKAIFDRVMTQLLSHYEAKNKEDQFHAFEPGIAGELDRSYAAIAEELGLSENATYVAFHRLRSRFRQILRDEVAETMLPGEDLDEELRYLASVL